MEIYAMTKEHALWEQTIAFAEKCSWKAGPYLANMMRQNKFQDWERVFAACEGENIVGYCTFTEKDELPDIYDFAPFIGFVFVDEKYRGNRISEKMIEAVLKYAGQIGYEAVYLMSGELGLYEKYGFEKIGDYETIFKTVDHLFVRTTKEIQGSDIQVRIMREEDIPFICKADNDESEGNVAYLENQLANQEKQECTVLIALYNGEVAGYVFLYYKCRWGGMANCNIPGIVDLIVFPKFRRRGIATALMDEAEKVAKKHHNKVYLDVCLCSEYGPAQRFYAKRGYVPDGKGVYYEEKVCETDAVCKNDDELTLCLVKERL